MTKESEALIRNLKKLGHGVSEKYVGNNERAPYQSALHQTLYNHHRRLWLFQKLQNILIRNFSPTKPRCTDITYIWTYEDGFVYLTSIMDLYSRKIIAWTLSKTMGTKTPVVIHGDKGSQFTSKKIRSTAFSIKWMLNLFIIVRKKYSQLHKMYSIYHE